MWLGLACASALFAGVTAILAKIGVKNTDSTLATALRRGLNASPQTSCHISLRADVSRVGGGAFPQYDLPTTLVCLKPAACSPTALKAALLRTEPPLIGRLEDDSFCLDPRTLDTADRPILLRVLREALALAATGLI